MKLKALKIKFKKLCCKVLSGESIGRNVYRSDEITTKAMDWTHGLIIYIDAKAKCRHITNFSCKGIFRQIFIPV
jgi:hypothetical protein